MTAPSTGELPSSREQLKWISLNVLSATSIVFVNKLLFTTVKMSPIWLGFIHFSTTFVVLHILSRYQTFQPSSVSLTSRPVLSTSAFLAGFVCMTNLSLRVNSVGIFQIFKIMNTPVVVLWDYIAEQKLPSSPALLGIVLVIVGAVGTVETDVTLAAEGLLVGICACLLTVKYQKVSRQFQSDERLSALQLLHKASPVGAAFLAVAGVVEFIGTTLIFPDNSVVAVSSSSAMTGIWEHGLDPQIIVPLAITSLLAVLVNLSTFRVVAVTSVLTYNIVGHTKTIVVLTGGALLFGEYISGGKGVFMVITLSGIMMYSYVAIQERTHQARLAREEELATAMNLVMGNEGPAGEEKV